MLETGQLNHAPSCQENAAPSSGLVAGASAPADVSSKMKASAPTQGQKRDQPTVSSSHLLSRQKQPSSPPVLDHSASSSSLRRQKKSSLGPSTSSSASQSPTEPSGPVLVNPGLPPSAPTSTPRTFQMHIPLSPHSLSRAHRRPKGSSPPHARPPSPTSFSFTSILSSLSSDPSTQADIDAIAEICGRSHLSLANEYGAHRRPIGAGIDVRVGEDTVRAEDDENTETHAVGRGNLGLDTSSAAMHRDNGIPTPNALETVEETPTPLSAGSRIGSTHPDPTDLYGSNSVSVSSVSRSPTASATSDEVSVRWGFLDVWERGAQQDGRGRPAGRSVLGLSVDVEAVGEGDSYSLQNRGEIRDDVSGAAGSAAVRQLMRVAGG